jgi:hypothetical protein
MSRIANVNALRRLDLKELIAKLEEIEQQASMTLKEYRERLTPERQRLILGLARQMRFHLKDQLQRGEREPAANDAQRPASVSPREPRPTAAT